MSKEEAQRRWLEAVKPIMIRENYDWTHPDKARIDKEYEKCVAEQLAEGKTIEDIKRAREEYLAAEEARADEEMRLEEDKAPVKLPPRKYILDIMLWLFANCYLVCCLVYLARSVYR